MSLQLAALLATFNRWGVPVTHGDIVPGLRRPGGEPEVFLPDYVMLHHTGSGMPKDGPYPNREVLRRGRPGLRGPLCQLAVRRDLIVDVVSLGKANHAGPGGPWRGLPADRGNTHAIGVEIEHNGTDAEPWRPEMLAFCHLVAAALCDMLGNRSGNVLAHKEWAPDRKIDPFRWNMGHARAEIGALLAAGPPTRPEETPEDDDMKATDQITVGPGVAAALGLAAGDTDITYGEGFAVQAAAAKQTEKLLGQLLVEIRGLRADLAARDAK